jgi:hypothetical protein
VALKQEGYELLEGHDRSSAVVIVDYTLKTLTKDVSASSIYTPGPRRALFSVSLQNVNRQNPASDATDFARIDGLPGVYIANQLLPRFGGADAIASLVDAPMVATRISFNGGGDWAAIPAPKAYANAGCDRCAGAAGCALHLHGNSAWHYGSIAALFPNVYSHPAAPGVIMASGNVAAPGDGLDDNDGLCTWLSTDGGASWRDVAEGAWIYEYADWGGMLVMARHAVSGPADEVRFSLDGGGCWSAVPLATALSVENIRIEPDGQRPKVLVHGRACTLDAHPKCSIASNTTARSTTPGLVFALDIAALAGPTLRACGADDFAPWTFADASGAPACLLGQKMAITRRKPGAVCLQGAAYQRPRAVNSTCACTAADVECDFGYAKAEGGSGACLPMAAERLPFCPTLAAGAYDVSTTGQRLLHGDVCAGINALIPDTDGRGRSLSKRDGDGGGGASPGGGGYRFMVFVLVLIAIGLPATAWYSFAATEDQRGVVRAVGAASYEAVASAVGACATFVSERISPGLRGYRRPMEASNDDLNYFEPLPPDGGYGALGGPYSR